MMTTFYVSNGYDCVFMYDEINQSLEAPCELCSSRHWLSSWAAVGQTTEVGNTLFDVQNS
jgi:hypothetical protein